MNRLCFALAICVFCFLSPSCAKKEQVVAVPNSEKPVLFYNRQPGDAESGKIDSKVLFHNESTFFVGPDARGGGALQGAMVAEFLNGARAAAIDRNGDGIIGYVLCIGSASQMDASLRTEGVRKALGTWNGSAKARDCSFGSIKMQNEICLVQELDSRVMQDSSGAAWSVKAASEAMAYWLRVYGDKIDMVISNNDAMALSCIATKGFPRGIPVFGYDANAEAIAAISRGEMTGTISQNFDCQAALTMQMMRSLLDGVSGEDCVNNGIAEADLYGNKITVPLTYDSEKRSALIKNAAVTKANCALFSQKNRHDGGIKPIDQNGTEKKVLMTVYNENSFFTMQQLVPAMKYYAEALNMNLVIIKGNGRSDTSILQEINDVSEYDGFLFNLVGTNQGRSYLERIR